MLKPTGPRRPGMPKVPLPSAGDIDARWIRRTARHGIRLQSTVIRKYARLPVKTLRQLLRYRLRVYCRVEQDRTQQQPCSEPVDEFDHKRQRPSKART